MVAMATLAQRGAAVAAAAALSVAPALANDTTAELATGGLVFVKNAAIAMRSERLFVSTEQIRVTYRFFNNSAEPVTNLVAFPMPDITIDKDDPDADIAVPTEDSVNFLGFTTTANGARVTTQVEQKAFAKGLDQTVLLRRLGIPLALQLKATYDALDALPKDRWQQLIDLGLAGTNEYGTSIGAMQQHLEPRWTLKTTYFWQQIFRPKTELVIEHQYKPSVGESVGTVVGDPQSSDLAEYEKKYCLDPDLIAAAARDQQAARQGNYAFGEMRIDYILKTGTNWAGPIADFTLTVDKGDPANLISFCANGVKKLSPTQFQVHYANFTPKSDLAVLILTGKVVQSRGRSRPPVAHGR